MSVHYWLYLYTADDNLSWMDGCPTPNIFIGDKVNYEDRITEFIFTLATDDTEHSEIIKVVKEVNALDDQELEQFVKFCNEHKGKQFGLWAE